MGEPRPGDFPDPINVRGSNVLLKTDQIGAAGGYVRADQSADPVNWQVLNTTVISQDGISVLGGAIEQLQQDVVSTGIADNLVNAATFGVGSWFYGISNGKLNPNDFVMLSRRSTVMGFENQRHIKISTAALASTLLTINTASDHHLKVGDVVTISGFTPAPINGTWPVTAITDKDTAVIDTSATGTTVTVIGFLDTYVTASEAHAQFVKKSGATYNQGAITGDICVFSMLKGGQPTS